MSTSRFSFLSFFCCCRAEEDPSSLYRFDQEGNFVSVYEKRLEQLGVEEKDIPEEFICPITLQVMVNPVISADGQAYERIVLEGWYDKSDINPMTLLTFTAQQKTCQPDDELRKRIIAFIGLKEKEAELRSGQMLITPL